MFQSVRHWWGSGRGKVTARLFAFEFVVVVLGVLVAQGLANWAAERGVRQQAMEEDARIRYEIGRTRQNYRVWQAAIPCLRERVDLMLRAAQTGSPEFSEAQLAMPRMSGYNVEPVSVGMDRPLRDLVGANQSDLYGGISNQSATNRARRLELGDQWAKFGLLSATDGQLVESDRATLRGAAVRIRHLLNSIERDYGSIDAQGARLGIAPISSGMELAIADKPVTSCEEIWRNHDIVHHPAA